MIRVNLLPHREMRRRRQQKEFLFTLGAVMVVGAGIWLVVHTSLMSTYESQIGRNQYLESEITKLDKEIADIKKLKEMTSQLLSRKKVVETLQSNRSDVVHLLDELARQLPEGIYLKSIKQVGGKVTINGFTQSQARVSGSSCTRRSRAPTRARSAAISTSKPRSPSSTRKSRTSKS